MPNILGGAARLAQLLTKPAAPPAGNNNLYFKNDNLLYRQGSDGVEYPVDTTTIPTAAPAYRGEWVTQDTQNLQPTTWTGRFGWQSKWTSGGTFNGAAPTGILDSNTGANPGEFIIQNAGYYQVNVSLGFSPDPGTAIGRQVHMLRNGTVHETWANHSAGNQNLSVGGSCTIYCAAGDVLRFEGWHNLSTALAWNGNYDRNVLTIASCGQGPAGPAGGNPYTPNLVEDIWSTNSASIAASTFTTVTGWSLSSGNTSYYGAINNGVKTISNGGMYLVNAWVTWTSVTGGRRLLALYKNGMEVGRQDTGTSGGGQATQNVTAFMPLAVNDTLAVTVWQNSGGAVALSGSAPAGTYGLGGHHWQLWKVSDAQTFA